MAAKPKHKAKPRQAPEKPKSPENSISSTIIIALIGGVVTIITAIIALVDPQTLTSFFLRTHVAPTTTPFPFARIQSLEVIEDGTLVHTVNPGQFIEVRAESNVVVKVIVISNTDTTNLMFNWEFCESGNDVRGQGAIEIPYRLNAQGEDCIAVKIEKGGEFLDTANFFVRIR